MVEQRTAPADLDRIFHALADPTRRGILAMVASGERTVGELADPFPTSFAAVSKHVKVLEAAGLVRRRWVGREARLTLEPARLASADAWLEHYRVFWERRLDALERMVGEPSGERPDRTPRAPANPTPSGDPTTPLETSSDASDAADAAHARGPRARKETP